MLACDQVVNDSPTMCDEATRELRYRLIGEELAELLDACVRKDLPDIADAIGDGLYVVAGSFVSHGLVLQEEPTPNTLKPVFAGSQYWAQPVGTMLSGLLEYEWAKSELEMELALERIASRLFRLANLFDIDIEPILDLIHEANMKKLTGLKDANGKQLKPPGFEPPDIAAELRRQGWDK